MHAHNRDQSASTNPYIQIMFNINSKNVVNNNIVTDRQKDMQLGFPPQLMPEKIDKTFIFPEKKSEIELKSKSIRVTPNKAVFTGFKGQDNLVGENPKPKKKSTKGNKSILSGSQTQRSAKNTLSKKNTSQGLSKLAQSEQPQLSSGKQLHKSKSKLKTNKDTRQKIIELMIRDYEKGAITAQNFKVAVSSLIEKQTQEQKKPTLKSIQSRTDKSRTRIQTSYKNSQAASLHNTPKHRPLKSKSQKFHHPHSYQPSTVLRMKQSNNEEPEIVERIIDRKDFVNKIIIKGINSSLFLSNEWTDKDSPQKLEAVVSVNVINTSDSVRDLKKRMHNVAGNGKNAKHQVYASSNGDLQSVSREVDRKKEKTLDILQNFIRELKTDSKNQFMQSGISLKSSQNYMNGQFQSQNIEAYSIDGQEEQQEEKQTSSLDEFYIRQEDFFDPSKQPQTEKNSKIDELQQQYAELLKQQQDEGIQSVGDQDQCDQNIQDYERDNEGTGKKFVDGEFKIKSYVSSQLQNKQTKISAGSSLLSGAKQQMNQKIAKSITQGQIKILNQILDSIKSQLTSKKQIQTNKSIKDSEVLENIVSLLQNQRSKVQKEQRIFDAQGQQGGNKLVQTTQLADGKNSDLQEGRIEQNQIINSFRKKLNKKNIFQPTKQTEKPSNQQVHYQSSDSKAICVSSKKSVSSSSSISSTNHLEKVKISQLNLDQIQMGLRKRLSDLQLQKQQQYSVITQKFINDKITAKQYQEQKEIIEKWFEIEVKALKKTKKNLVEGYKKAKQFLQKDYVFYETRLTKEKSVKMIKSISEKYLAKINNLKSLEFQGEDQPNSKDSINEDQIKSRINKKEKPTKKTKSSKIYYQTIQQELEDELIRNITPIQKFLCLDQHQNQESNIFSPLTIYSENVSNETPLHEKLIELQSCENKRLPDDAFVVSESPLVFEQNNQNELESSKINVNKPTQADQIEEEVSESQQDHEDQSNDSNYLQYDGYVDVDDHSENGNLNQLKQENQIDRWSSLGQELKQAHLDSKKIEQHANISIIVNKRSPPSQSPQNHEELFSPKKPTVYQQFSEQLLQYNSSSDPSQPKSSLQFISLNKEFNQNYVKLKYLTEEDKDDLFQFIFLDLVIEIYLEQRRSSKILKSLEKYSAYLRMKRKTPKGFKTGLDNCKTYVNQMQRYLLKDHFDVLKRLQSPIGPSAKQMLKFMRDYDDLSQSSGSSIQTINLVLPIEVYEQFQLDPVNKLQVERYYENDQKEESRLKFLRSLKHFHNKAIFDSLNEMLDVERCYGIWGKPFPWKKALNVDRKFEDGQIKSKLKKASQKVLENCSYFCGVLADKEECVFGKTNVSEEYLQYIREDRMSKMLSNDMMDNQDRWIFYDDQETEVLVSISKSITNTLITEVLQQMKLISWK